MSVQEKLSGSWVASLVDESAKGCDVGLVNKRQIGSLLQEYCTGKWCLTCWWTGSLTRWVICRVRQAYHLAYEREDG